jgi:CBS domain-containing protein
MGRFRGRARPFLAAIAARRRRRDGAHRRIASDLRATQTSRGNHMPTGDQPMSVTAILKQKGSSKVTTIRPDATLAECARMLTTNKIGALVVSTDGRQVDGIISERDVVRVVAEHGALALSRPVHNVMTVNVETCGMSDRALDLLQRMTEGRFRHLPVVRDGKLEALISIGDVVKFRLSEIEMERAALEDMVKGF